MKSNRVIYGSRRYYPLQVTVCTGKGTVWENPTRGLPILNPTSMCHIGAIVSGICQCEDIVMGSVA